MFSLFFSCFPLRATFLCTPCKGYVYVRVDDASKRRERMKKRAPAALSIPGFAVARSCPEIMAMINSGLSEAKPNSKISQRRAYIGIFNERAGSANRGSFYVTVTVDTKSSFICRAHRVIQTRTPHIFQGQNTSMPKRSLRRHIYLYTQREILSILNILIFPSTIYFDLT